MLLLCSFIIAGVAETVEGPKSCKLCNMDRTRFTHSRMLIVYGDDTRVGVCSLHCAAEELYLNRARQVRSLMVADYYSLKLIDARTASWVVGGRKPGVMTGLAKWAFDRPEDARRFIKENEGALNSYDLTMDSATREVMDQLAEEKAAEREIQREQVSE